MDGQEPNGAVMLDEAVLLNVLSDVKSGDFTVRMPVEWTGVAGKIADRLNDVIAANQTLGDRAGAGQPRRRQGGQALPARRRYEGTDQVLGRTASSRSTA